MKRYRALDALWHLANVFFFASLVLLLYSAGWEYSTRKYLRGFSDAIVPALATPEEKIDTILGWMQNGPSRRAEPVRDFSASREPQDTLNYRALLQVCGTATNAFVNLANSSGLPSRRLLLLDDHRVVNHVVAEVLVGGRWIVVDPGFRFIPRGPHGETLTREELSDPAVFRRAVQGISNYHCDYDYDIGVHVRIGRMPVLGHALRPVLDRFLPGWEDSVYWTLLLERKSFAALNLAILLVLFFFFLRVLLRWYSETRLGIHRVRVREQFVRAVRIFLGGTT